MSDHNSNSSGVGGLFLLFLVFLILKLTGEINWSWWWVTCPLWGPAVLAVIGFLIISWLGK